MDHVLMRWSGWNVDEQRFDPAASLDEKLRVALQCAVLAPSSHNTQPWRFIVDGDAVIVCADRTRALPVVDPFDRELIISCGAALFNLRVALSRFDLACAITVFPSNADPDVVAHLRIVANGHRDASLAALFPAIGTRVTTREAFTNRPIADTTRRALIDAGVAEGALIAWVDFSAQRERIAALIADADRQQFADPRFRRELASWLHPRRRHDGMPAYAASLPVLLDFATPLLAQAIRTFDLGGGMAAAHHRLVEGSPLFVGIATERDDREAWLAAGAALERLLLTAAGAGLSASYLNQPIEVETLRERLRPLFGIDAEPQLLLRVGRGPAVPHSPRRPLADVVS